MKFAFAKHGMTLAHMQQRIEQHGPDPVLAMDLKLHFQSQSKILDEIDPSIRTFLFGKPKKGADLADQSNDDATARTNIVYPLKLSRGLIDAKLKLRLPGDTERVQFGAVKVNNIQFTAKDGGIVDIHFRAQVHPTSEQVGKVATMLRKDVQVSLTSGKEDVAPDPEDENPE